MANRGINKVILLGYLGQDPEVRRTTDGNTIVNLNIATSEVWRDKQSNELKDKTEWHRVVMFRKLAEIAEQYLRKGAQVYIEGALQTRKWQDQQGQNRYTTEILANEMQMIGGRSEESHTSGISKRSVNNTPESAAGFANKSNNHAQNRSPASPLNEMMTQPLEEFDDDIPF